ncbi:MAG: molybdopterin cofactor-binding domain-containing protein [Gemmatimonadaceae bacterium]
MRRRTFLLMGLGATGALIVGWSLVPPRQRLRATHAADLPDGAIQLNGWLAIAPDGTVTVISPKAEMGQGIHTALAMLIAEELAVPLERVQVVHAPIDTIYGNIAALADGLPLHPDQATSALGRTLHWFTAKTARELGVLMTGGSSSVRDVWAIAREAGATARVAFVAAAAARFGVPPDQCRAEQGRVICGDRSIGYGEIIEEAAAQQPAKVALKDPATFTLIGTDVPRLDSRAKAVGAPVFGIDRALPGMLQAAVAMPPALGSRPARFDREAALAQPGVKAVVPLEGSSHGDPPGVAIIAETWWKAKQALAALAIEWSPSPHAALDSASILRTLREVAETDDGLPFRKVGDPAEALATAATVIEARYEAPYLAHATMEPMNAVVRVEGDAAELWCGTQVPRFARDAVARVLDCDPDQVTLHQSLLGGGFGRRLEVDYVAQAAAVAKAMPGTPVQVIWSREDDLRFDMYRPAAASRLEGGLDAQGRLVALTAHSAGQSAFKALSKRVGIGITSFGPDRTTAEGTWDQPYEIPNLRSAHQEVELPVAVGSWRSVGHSHQAFFFESFIDELAHAAGQDPVAFRLAHLREHPRAARVLSLAAERAGWGTPLTPTADRRPRARGVALHWSFGSLVAQVAEVSVSAAREIRVHRVTAAVDCGLAVHPRGIRQQVEGAVLDGLSAALHGEIRIAEGRIATANFDTYRMLRITEAPAVDVHIVPSTEVPTGMGEPALPPVAPAVANAVFALTGERLRTLPLRLGTTT